MYIITLCILRGRARCCTVWTIIFAVLNFCKCLPICELGLEEIVLKKSRPPWSKSWQDFHSPSGWYQTAGCLTCFSQLRSPHFNLRKLWRFSPGKMKLCMIRTSDLCRAVTFQCALSVSWLACCSWPVWVTKEHLTSWWWAVCLYLVGHDQQYSPNSGG